MYAVPFFSFYVTEIRDTYLHLELASQTMRSDMYPVFYDFL